MNQESRDAIRESLMGQKPGRIWTIVYRLILILVSNSVITEDQAKWIAKR